MEEQSWRYVGIKEGRTAWARAAFDILVETASRYNGLIVYSDLAEQIQRRTGLWTRADQRNWIGGVLGDVVRRCHDEGLPPLTALVVHKHDGMVGVGYDEVLSTAGLKPIDDQLEREQHAAGARLECYRRWCSHLPSSAKPALSRQMQDAVSRRQRRREPAASRVCPTCHMEMPMSGICPECAD